MYGVLIEEQGIAARATFVVDKDGIVRYQLVNDLDIRRDEKELLRIVKAVAELKR